MLASSFNSSFSNPILFSFINYDIVASLLICQRSHLQSKTDQSLIIDAYSVELWTFQWSTPVCCLSSQCEMPKAVINLLQ